MIKSGIYRLSSQLKPERFYIGSSVNMDQRKSFHYSFLQNNKHHSHILQNHCNKYGIDDLTFEIIEYCEKDKLLEREQFYLDSLKPYFNIEKIAGRTLGKKGIPRSEETKQKISQSKIGHLVSLEARKKMSISRKGKYAGKNSPSYGKIGIWTGKKRSEEDRKKMSISQNPKKKPILQFDLAGNFIQEFESITEMQRKLGFLASNIRRVINTNGTAYNYIWKHKKLTKKYSKDE